MNKLKFAFASLLLIAFCLSESSCKKITEDNLINGLWVLNNVNVDTSTANFLNTLPLYNSSAECCQYKMDFEKDGTLVAFYLTYDSIHSVMGGTWEVTQYKQVYMQVGNFIDGTFDIEQPSLKKRVLTSEQNHIKAFDGVNPALDTAYTKMEMEKL